MVKLWIEGFGIASPLPLRYCTHNRYNVTIENNTVFNSAGSGFMFSRDIYNSLARDYIVHNESKCAFMSQSRDNEIYNNRVDDCNNGIYLFNNPLSNLVHNNTVAYLMNEVCGIAVIRLQIKLLPIV